MRHTKHNGYFENSSCFAAVNAAFPLSSCCDFNSTTGPHIVSRLLHSSCDSVLTLTPLSRCVSLCLFFLSPFFHTGSLLRNNSWVSIRATTVTANNCKGKLIRFLEVYFFKISVLIMRSTDFYFALITFPNILYLLHIQYIKHFTCT